MFGLVVRLPSIGQSLQFAAMMSYFHYPIVLVYWQLQFAVRLLGFCDRGELNRMTLENLLVMLEFPPHQLNLIAIHCSLLS